MPGILSKSVSKLTRRVSLVVHFANSCRDAGGLVACAQREEVRDGGAAPHLSADVLRRAGRRVRAAGPSPQCAAGARLPGQAGAAAARAAALDNVAAGRRLGKHANWVRYWRRSWATEGFRLTDKAGRGRKPAFSPPGGGDGQ